MSLWLLEAGFMGEGASGQTDFIMSCGTAVKSLCQTEFSEAMPFGPPGVPGLLGGTGGGDGLPQVGEGLSVSRLLKQGFTNSFSPADEAPS